MDYKIPRGTYDVLPEESYRRQFVAKAFEEVAMAFGYSQISTPVFEQSELFERSSGESSDIVQKEMYRFKDKKDRIFALRPEGTAPVVRSYVENRMDIKGRISKLWYSGPMFRYDRPQAGRYRQFYQYGIELIGSNHPYFDAEVIAFEWAFLDKLGLDGIRLEINSVGCPNCSKTYDQALKEFFAQWIEDMCPDCKQRFEQKPRRLLDCKVPSCKAISKDAPSQLDYLDDECKFHFKQVCRYLSIFEVPYTINPKIVRGLDYYTNTAFEFINDSLGAQNSIAGGGRYNGLIEQIGGKSIPAIGFAGGWERLMLSLDNARIIVGSYPNPSAYMVAMGDSVQPLAIDLISKLRKHNLYIEYDPEKTSLKAQMKAADSKQARFALILGDDEMKNGMVLLKDLQSGSQESVAIDNIPLIVEKLSDKEA